MPNPAVGGILLKSSNLRGRLLPDWEYVRPDPDTSTPAVRHFAFFWRHSGLWSREWKGPVGRPDLDPALLGDARLTALNAWQQHVAPADTNEIGLDVTHYHWPVGDFCYCTFDPISRFLDWGPPRYYIELRVADGYIVSNVESHRPITESSVPGQVVIDITGTALQQYHGDIRGHLLHDGTLLRLVPWPLYADGVQRQLTEAVSDLELIHEPTRSYVVARR